ncbi:hypothetical protein V2H45_05040 [Tumidithrix elongata RA019]|uniref:Lipoprotein n=1 Tax=Tumidithrix elongata BACA0141 TaxID=2716417 RepID=A0AAW9PXW8_9CYAN|nr:hypothetical protein [Tumidithrix elongata RA019]
MHLSIRAVLLTLFLTVSCQSNLAKSEARQHRPNWNAEIRHDCAPWDGSAFRITLTDSNDQKSSTTTIDVAIWQAPAFNEPVSFTLTESSRIGRVRFVTQFGTPSVLTGQIGFKRVKESEPVEGNFDFVTKQGDRKQGTFRAIWKPNSALCG